MKVALVADLLDKRILDMNGRYVGTVDSVVLEMTDTGTPRVTGIEVGAPALLRRVHPALARWLRRLPVSHIPMSKIREMEMDVEVEIDGERHSTLLTVEKWLRSHVVEHIPGNGR